MARFGRLVLERLMRYYRFVAETTTKKTIKAITSAQIAEALDIDPTQVRKDLAAVGIVGMGRVGFDVCEVCRAIRVVLGFDERYDAVLVGAGHLGSSLLAYSGFTRQGSGFARYGLHILAAFDNDKDKVGSEVAGRTVKSMKALIPFVKRNNIRLAILTTPAEVSQRLTDRLVPAGVKAIWNFTPTQLVVPPGILVRNEHISIGLSQLAYHLKESESSAP